MKMSQKIGVVFSAHLGCDNENIGDILSAKALAILIGKKNIPMFCLPRDIGLSDDISVIYGGGGMIRPRFSQKEYQDYLLRDKNIEYAIYGVGINIDNNGDDFSKEDMKSLGYWFRGASSITVRDKTSQSFVKKKFFCSAKIAPCPTYTVLRMINKLPKIITYKIGFVPSFGHTEAYRRYLYEIESFIYNLLTKVNPDEVCIICHDEQDYRSANKLYSKMGVCVIKPLSFKDVHSVYSSCESIISLRGHGIIFAAATGRPCSFIPLNLKLNSLYSFHYGGGYRKINFDIDYHLNKLRQRNYPLSLKINFKF